MARADFCLAFFVGPAEFLFRYVCLSKLCLQQCTVNVFVIWNGDKEVRRFLRVRQHEMILAIRTPPAKAFDENVCDALPRIQRKILYPHGSPPFPIAKGSAAGAL